MYIYSHALLNCISVNNEPHIGWWSHKIIMNYKQKGFLPYLKERLDLTKMLNIILAVGGLNR